MPEIVKSKNKTPKKQQVAQNSSISMGISRHVNFEQAILGLNARELRSFDLLPKDVGILFDKAIVRVAQEEVIGIADLFSRGLVETVAGTSILEYKWQRSSRIGNAKVGLSPDSQGESDRQVYDTVSISLPVFWDEFIINLRDLNSALRSGYNISTSVAEDKSAAVILKRERALFNGLDENGMNFYGYKTFPDRHRYRIKNWADPTVTTKEIVDDIIALTNILELDLHRGPYILYIPPVFSKRFKEDYKDDTTLTSINTRTRALQIEGLENIRVSPSLNADEVVLVEMASRNVMWINGQDLIRVPWFPDGHKGWEYLYKIYLIGAPKLISDMEGHCGILHADTTYTPEEKTEIRSGKDDFDKKESAQPQEEKEQPRSRRVPNQHHNNL